MNLDNHLIAEIRPLANPANIILWNDFRVTVLSERLFRIEEDEAHIFCDEATEAVWFRDMPPVPFAAEEKDGELFIKTANAELVLNNTADVGYVILNGKKIALDNGENLRGTVATLDTCDGEFKKQDDGTFAPLALDMGVVSRNGVAVLDYTKSSVLTGEGLIRKERRDTKDIYVFAYGRDYRAALRAYYMICGAVPKLPRYALGNWWSRYHEYSDREYLNILDRLAARNIPITVATVDMDWHWNTFNISHAPRIAEACREDSSAGDISGWTGYSWNTELFPDYKAFLKKIHDRGCAVTLNLHPASGVRWFEDMYAEMAEAMGVNPDTKKTVELDFGDPLFINNYFKILHKPYEKDGVDFWWIDWQQGPRAKAAGIDIMWVLNHYHTLDNAKGNCTPLILSRYSGIGAHRYPLGFSGDTVVTWRTLNYQPYFTANASNIGFTWWSHDIGGHMGGVKDNELYLRSVQFGVFSPIMRLHCVSREYCTKEPTYYMGGTGLIAEEFMRLRHKMIPYLYSAMLDTHERGKALIEPMYYEYPENEEAYECPNQYFFGTELIVRPITEKADAKGMAKTELWLPEGRWTDIFTGETYTGGRNAVMVRFLESIPVLAKAGGFFVLDERSNTNDIGTPAHLRVMAMNGDGQYTFREDGAQTVFTARETATGQVFGVAATGTAARKMTFELRNIAEGDVTVFENGKITDAYVNNDGFLTVTLDEIKPDNTYTIEVSCVYDAKKYRNTVYLDALARIELADDRKNALWEARELDDGALYAKIMTEASLTENERLKLTEAWHI